MNQEIFHSISAAMEPALRLLYLPEQLKFYSLAPDKAPWARIN